jgi:hypothetical protein
MHYSTISDIECGWDRQCKDMHDEKYATRTMHRENPDPLDNPSMYALENPTRWSRWSRYGMVPDAPHTRRLLCGRSTLYASCVVTLNLACLPAAAMQK